MTAAGIEMGRRHHPVAMDGVWIHKRGDKPPDPAPTPSPAGGQARAGEVLRADRREEDGERRNFFSFLFEVGRGGVEADFFFF